MYLIEQCGQTNYTPATANQISAFQAEQTLIQSILAGTMVVPANTNPDPGSATGTPAALSNFAPGAGSPSGPAIVTPGSPSDISQAPPGSLTPTPIYTQSVFLTLPECFQRSTETPLLTDCCGGYPTGSCAGPAQPDNTRSLFWAALLAAAAITLS
jgi:peptidoglycan hydrolase-like protein with peptidoglycan-binding domain